MLPRPVLLGALALLLASTPAIAVSATYTIEIDNVGGIVRFTDPAGFTCVNGSAPQHAPPASAERRCTPTFAATTCGDPSVSVAVMGGGSASAEANGQCNTFGASPPLASCSAAVPRFALLASCTNGPTSSSMTGAVEFVCHAPASGAWFRYHVACSVVVG